MLDTYLFGMTVHSTIHLLHGSYPEADTYGEIAATHCLPGGETGNSAVVLAALGYRVSIDGPFLGTETKEPITAFYAERAIDTALLAIDETYAGLRDMVLVAGDTRTVFGSFGQYFSGGKRWNKPDAKSIGAARLVTIDPFFGAESEEAARLCVDAGTPYVTIDCVPDSYLGKHAAANVVSGEFLRNEFPEAASDERAKRALIGRYAEEAAGLVVFTSGSKPILYARKGAPVRSVDPFTVEVKSTLGAGDTFRAGIASALLDGLSDEEAVRFAAATAACVCKRFPFALDPPTKEEISALARSR
jgi:sugar/nucleoside kinase (ribokinase family)